MKVSGTLTNSTAGVSRLGRTAHGTRVSTAAARRRAKASSPGRTGPNTLGVSWRTTYMAKGFTAGATDGRTAEVGTAIACTGTVYSRGWTAGSTRGSTIMIINTARASSVGPMGASTTDNG